jgi:hypothetical protein
VDPKRVNEYGFRGEPDEDLAEVQNGTVPEDKSQPKPIEDKKKD